MATDDVEYEFGVPIPGRILPPERWARTAVKRLPDPGPLDFSAYFGRSAPLILDLGCGNGRYTLLSALARPDHDHFATDVLPVVIRYATRRGNQRGLTNARFAVKDAQTFVSRYVGDGAAAEAHLYHPQPYHDPRQASRRLVSPAFAAEIHRILAPGGLFVVQTDNPDYWAYMTRLLPHFFHLEEHPEPWPDSPAGRSRREIVALQRGMRIFRGLARRRDEIDAAGTLDLARSLPPPNFRTRGPWTELDRLEREGG